MKSIIFIAPPAAGKGTQSKLVSEKYNIPHISTGALLREAVEKNDEKAHLIENIMKNGNLVSDEIILELLQERLKQPDCNQGYILDGFPRNKNQAIEYDKILKDIKRESGIVFYLDINEEEAKKRITGRISCNSCGSIYNEFEESLKPTKVGYCNKCNGELIKRKDDNLETFEERYKTFIEKTKPLIEYYEQKGLLYHIDSSINKEYTFKQIEKVLENIYD